MSPDDYNAAREIGYGRCEFHTDPMVGEDSFEYDDRIFPLAFSDALEAFPQYEAPDISEAVHDGISAYWDSVR